MNVRQYKKLILLYLSVLTAILSSVIWLVTDAPWNTSDKKQKFVHLQQEEITRFEHSSDSLLYALASQFSDTSNHFFQSFHSLLLQENIDIFTHKTQLFGDREKYTYLKQADFQGIKSKIIQTQQGNLLARKHSIIDKGIEIIFIKSTPFPFGKVQAQLDASKGLAIYNKENHRIGYLSTLNNSISNFLFINPISFYLLLFSFLLFTIWIILSFKKLYYSSQISRLILYSGGWCIALKTVDLAFAYRYPMYPYFLTTPFLEGSSWLNPTYLSRTISMVCVLIWMCIIALKLHRTDIYKHLNRVNGTNLQVLSISLLLIGFLVSQFIIEELKISYQILGISNGFSNIFRNNTQYILLLFSIHLLGSIYFLFLHPLFVFFNAINKNRIQAYLIISTSGLCWFLILSFSQIENQISLLLLFAWIIQYTFNLPQGFYSIRHKTTLYGITFVYLFSLFTTFSSYHFELNEADKYQEEIKEVILTSPSKELINNLFTLQKQLLADTSHLLLNQDAKIRNTYIQSISHIVKGNFTTVLTNEWRQVINNSYTNTSYKGIYRDNQSHKIALLLPKDKKWLIIELQVPILTSRQLHIRSVLNTQQKLSLFQRKVGIALIHLPTFQVYESFGDNIPINRNFKLKSIESTTSFAHFLVDSKRINQYQIGKNTLLVFQFPRYNAIDFWGNFAFISLVSFLLISLYFLIFFGLSFVRAKKVSSLTTKIVLYIQVSYLIPILLTILFVIYFFDEEIKKSQRENYLQETELIQSQIEPLIREWFSGERTDSSLVGMLSTIPLKPLHTLHFVDKQGKVIFASTELNHEDNFDIKNTIWDSPIADSPLIFEGITSTMPVTGIMRSIRSEYGKKIGSIQLHFLDSEIQYVHRITEVIQSILVVFLIIFNGLFFISFFISKKLINPIKAVAIRLKNTTLSELTEKELIPFVKHDEIGLLVDAYNGMIKKLDESKNAIAEAEKQTAWQEIAKQVAHEIKNPLTPMKLSIQQLQRNLIKNPGQPLTPEMKETLSLLIDQIDDISAIASSFSSYAQMPIPKKVRINLVEVVQKSVQFMLTSQQTQISLHFSQNEIWVLQDPSFMDRLLKNILLNGIQSVPKGVLPEIEVQIEQRSRSAVISIKDNGVGIPDENKEKIFLPHFSTKKIGSGIGLAIAKKGIESMGGNIWFESQEGKGTTFYVEVPLQGTIL